MKKLLLFLALPLIALALNSCSDDKNDETPVEKAKLVKTIKGYIYESFKYDAENRVVEYINDASGKGSHTAGASFETSKIEYKSGKATMTTTDLNYPEAGAEVINLTFNSSGYVAKVEVDAHIIQEYEYAGAYVSKCTEYQWSEMGEKEYSTVTTYTWNGGNLSKVAGINKNDLGEEVGGYSMTFTYTDKANKASLNEYLEVNLYSIGKQSKNFIATVTIKETRPGEEEENFASTFKYEFDADGYPTKITTLENDVAQHADMLTYY